MRMQKKQFRIGELANKLGVEKFVVRFWEKEFNIQTNRSSGKQRYYTEQDLETFQEIKELLYHQGFTIAGAKKQMETGLDKTTILASQKTTMEDTPQQNEEFIEQCLHVQRQLLKLRELL